MSITKEVFEMKNNIKSFICGMLVMGVISSAAVIAADNWQSINVLPNTIKVVVDGKEVQADNFLYNDTTYLPIRAVSEALKMDVQYDNATSTATISEKREDDNMAVTSKYTPPAEYRNDSTYFILKDSIWYVSMNYVVDNKNEFQGITGDSDGWNDDNTIDINLYKNGEKVTTVHCIDVYSQGVIPYDQFVDEIEPLLK